LSTDCEFITKCGYYKKYGGTGTKVHRDFLLEYCRGPKGSVCSRKQYRKENGKPPLDEMLPTGEMIK